MIPEGVAVVGGVLLVALVIMSFVVDGQRKNELVSWAVSRGGRATAPGVTVPANGAEVDIRRVRIGRLSGLEFSVRLAKHLEPVKINADEFRPDASPGFRRVATNADLCAALVQLKGREFGIRRPNHQERKAGAVGSYVYVLWWGPITNDERNHVVTLIARVASLI